jgi:hypothetical protein
LERSLPCRDRLSAVLPKEKLEQIITKIIGRRRLVLPPFGAISSAAASRGQNKSSPKSYAKAERIRNNVVARKCNIQSLWIAIDMRQF